MPVASRQAASAFVYRLDSGGQMLGRFGLEDKGKKRLYFKPSSACRSLTSPSAFVLAHHALNVINVYGAAFVYN